MPRGLRWKGGIPPEEREKFGVREAEPRGENRSRNLARVSLLGGQRGILIVLPFAATIRGRPTLASVTCIGRRMSSTPLPPSFSPECDVNLTAA